MPDRPPQSKPSPANTDHGPLSTRQTPGAASVKPAAAISKGQRDISAVAADLAIQQENEGLRLALREQERIVEELTNECRRLEDRLEDRYQDIDALRRELDRGERALKQAEERSSQLVGDSAMPAATQPGMQATADAKTTTKSPAESARAGSGRLGFASGLLTGLVLATVAVMGLWSAGLLTLSSDMAISPEITAPVAPTQPPTATTEQTPAADDGSNTEYEQEVSNTRTSNQDKRIAGSNKTTFEPVQDGRVNEPSNGAPDNGSDNGSDSGPESGSHNGLNDGSASPEPANVDLQIPAEPVVGTHVDMFLVGEAKAPEMVVLEPSEFMMGNPVGMADSDARPVHKVSLDGFMIGTREVTFADYDRFVRETGARRPLDYGWGRGARPVIDVSWADALAYAKWLGKKTGQPYRLPSEAEWEYAARGGTTSSYWWGIGSPSSRALCINCGTRWDRISTAPVGSFPPNPFGLYDTAGNVYEWTADCYHHSYQGAPDDGRARDEPDCKVRVARGGSFNSPAGAMRSHARNRFSADARADILGFRVARDLAPQTQTSPQGAHAD
ncbi:Serine/threonine-protein kinase pkn1 [Thiorhodovibrio winogradskyi]|uniref:Serine/threonine-protein kinase pkn1 n=1 Tax=Thiorhodovibrio winogradskyi TaxID=77007 RepID=A0ABZ0S5T8_9GAMM|nr:SUMF1/EgtB/PvdO family nonheme iron enzyme [Thiorhodovibrio winogradskyi]